MGFRFSDDSCIIRRTDCARTGRANFRSASTKGIKDMFTPNEYGLFSMPTLETPRLILRRMTMKDAKDIFEYSRDEEVACHVLWSAQRDIGEAKDYCRYMLRRYRADEPSSWGIIDRQTRHLVGTIGYMDYSMDNASVEIGYSLARWLWNGGYMTEALAPGHRLHV